MMETPENTNGGESLFAAIRAAGPKARRQFLVSHDATTVSYKDMFARTARFANCLWKRGLRPGERLAVQIEKSADALFLYLACMRTGAIYLPLNPAYTPAELDYFLADAGPSCVVVSPDREQMIAALARGAATLTLAPDGRSGSLAEMARHMPDDFADVSRDAQDIAAILYTSGTTGRSKGAMLTHGNLVTNARALCSLWRFTPADVLLHALPIYHTHGLFTATNTVLLAGGSMIFLPKFDTGGILSWLPRATAMMGVPTFYTRLLADPRLTREATSHMRVFISGSAPLLEETHAAWRERTGYAILERYGMTETNMIASNPYEGERIAGTVGFPLPDVELRIANSQTGAALMPGQIGVIEVRGPNVFKGYWGKPKQTAEAFRKDGFFITGDLGMIDARGYLQIVGRAKDLVISGGFNVYPREVELEIDALTGISESAVIGVPHADLGEAVVAVVVRAPEGTISEADVLNSLSTRLAPYKLPRMVFFADALPRNAMGKVQKNRLREAHRATFGAQR